MTVAARILDDLSRPVATAAGRLIDHAPERGILDRLTHTGTATVRAVLRLRSRCRPGTAAGLAGFGTGYAKFRRLAERRFLKSNLQIIAQVTAAFRPRTALPAASAASAKKHIEDIAKPVGAAETAEPALAEAAKTAASAHAAFKSRMAELIVLRLFLRILQDIIGFVDFLKLFFSRFGIIAVQVRMIFAGHLFIGLFDFSCRGIFVNPQHLIVIAFLAHVAPSLFQSAPAFSGVRQHCIAQIGFLQIRALLLLRLRLHDIDIFLPFIDENRIVGSLPAPNNPPTKGEITSCRL